MNLASFAGIAALGYLAYKLYADKAQGKPQVTQPTEGPLPFGVRYEKTDKGSDFATFEPKFRDVVLAGLTAQVNNAIASTKDDDGPFSLDSRAPGILPSSFDFARDRSLEGKWVLVPQTIGVRYANGEDLTDQEALILAVSDEASLAMYSKSGWAAVASPGSLQWSVGLSNAAVFDKLSASADFTPSSGWNVRSTPAAMSPDALAKVYKEHLAAKASGAMEDLILSFAVEKDGTETIAAGRLAAEVTPSKLYPVVAIDQSAYPAPIPGTPFLLPENSIVIARRVTV